MNGRVVAVKSGRDPLSEERWAEIFRQPPTPPAVVQEKKPTMNELGITPENVESYWNELFGKYACPCGKKFDKKLSMLQHVQSIAHQRKTFLYVSSFF